MLHNYISSEIFFMKLCPACWVWISGSIINVETRDFAFQQWNGCDPDESQWVEYGNGTTSFLNVIRIFYEFGPPAYEEIGTFFVCYIISWFRGCFTVIFVRFWSCIMTGKYVLVVLHFWRLGCTWLHVHQYASSLSHPLYHHSRLYWFVPPCISSF